YAHAREMYTELFLTYAPNYFFGVFNLIAPICVGLWSVGWAFEDAGLIHYSLPKGGLEEYFEIEPVHYRYNTLLGGYAGLSAFFFYLGALLFYLVPGSRGYYLNPDPNSPGDLMVLFFMVTIAGLTPIMLVPAYLVYWLVGVNFLRKNLEESRGISEKEFRKSIVDKAYEGP
ncbi:MAG: hypothetical protein ACFFCO_09060, partial [Promethearchaeota archaeon]